MPTILTPFIFAVLFFSNLVFAQAPAPQISYDVVIVGGGIGGLSALHELKQTSLKVKLFEQKRRTGGRIFSIPNANPLGQTFDAGAALIDTDHLGMLKLSREFRVPLISRFSNEEERRRIYFFDGEILTGADLIGHFFETDLSALEKFQNDQLNLKEEFDRIDLMTADQYLQSIGASEPLIKYITAGMESEIGRSVLEVSAVTLFDNFGVDIKNKNILFLPHNDESLIIEGGSQRLTDQIYHRYKDDVETQATLLKVVENLDGSFELKMFQDGREFWIHSKKLVVAMPSFSVNKVSWSLLKHELPFGPADIPSFAANTKIFIYFLGRPWGTKPLPPILGTDAQGLHFQAWDGSNPDGSGSAVMTLYTGVHSSEEESLLVQNFLKQLDVLVPKSSLYYFGFNRYRWSLSYAGADRPGERRRIIERPTKIRNLFLVGEEYTDDQQGYMEGAVQTAIQAATQIKDCSETLLF